VWSDKVFEKVLKSKRDFWTSFDEVPISSDSFLLNKAYPSALSKRIKVDFVKNYKIYHCQKLL
jgi:hypothetical protein